MIENEKTVKIQKTKIDPVSKKKIKASWSFDLDHVYDEKVEIKEMYIKEIINTNFLENFLQGNNFKGSLVFVDQKACK